LSLIFITIWTNKQKHTKKNGLKLPGREKNIYGHEQQQQKLTSNKEQSDRVDHNIHAQSAKKNESSETVHNHKNKLTLTYRFEETCNTSEEQ
jgi:hypothetical protein